MNKDQWNQVKEDVRQRLDIVQVVERYVALKPAGANYKGLCPFHKEKSASFTVNPERGVFHCFGCGKGGDVFSFLMEYESLSFMEVLSQTAKEVGVVIDESQKPVYSGPSAPRSDLYRANDIALRYFYTAMRESEIAIAYFKNRGLSSETVRTFRLGFAPDCWNGVIDAARQEKLSEIALEVAGLSVKSAQGGKSYDRFRGRIIFPIFDMAGRPIAFGGRILDPEGQPKYLNSPETPLYQKNRVFYGLNQARDAMRECGSVIVVEGYMDLLALYEIGIKNVVATCGTALTNEHGMYLRRLVPKVTLLFDGDRAGIQATRRAIETLFPLEISVEVITLPTGDDPDTLIKREGAQAMIDRQKNTITALDFFVNLIEDSVDLGTPQGRAKVADQVADLIGKVSSDTVRSAYINMFGVTKEAYKIDEQYIRNRIKSQGSSEVAPQNMGKNDLLALLTTEEGSVLHLLVASPELIKERIPHIPNDLFTTSLFAELYLLVCSYGDSIQQALDNTTVNESVKQLLRVMIIEGPTVDMEGGQLEYKLQKLKARTLSRRKNLITQKLAATTSHEDKMALLAELQLLMKN